MTKHYINTTWNALVEAGICEPAQQDFAVRLVHQFNEGPTSYSIEVVKADGTWDTKQYEGLVLNLTGEQIHEAGSSLKGILGFEEMCSMIGVDKRIGAVMKERGQLPKPAHHLAATDLWWAHEVQAWKSKQKGKITAHGENKQKEDK